MATKTIYIFRHGQTDYNVARRVMGRLDIPLNETGLRQAAELAGELTATDIRAIYSSPLMRARQTATAVATKTGADIILNDGLMERDNGALQGHIVHATENPDEYQMDYDQMELFLPAQWLNDKNWRPDGGESRAECFRRAQDAIMDIIKNSPHETIAISTHSGPMRAALALAGGDGAVRNCDYVKLIFDGTHLTRG